MKQWSSDKTQRLLRPLDTATWGTTSLATVDTDFWGHRHACSKWKQLDGGLRSHRQSTTSLASYSGQCSSDRHSWDFWGHRWGTPSLATVHITYTYIFQHLSRDTDSQASLKQVRWDTPESTTSLVIPNLFQLYSIIITSLLLLKYTQFPHTRHSPHNVPHIAHAQRYCRGN